MTEIPTTSLRQISIGFFPQMWILIMIMSVNREERAHLQRLQEAEGAEASTPWHQAEGGVVQQLLVVEPSQTAEGKR